MQSQQQRLQLLLDENAISPEEFAYCLGLDPKQAEAFCQGTRVLTDRLARQIEQTFSKPAFWLEGTMSDGAGPSYDLFG